MAALPTSGEALATEAELECRCDKANGEPLWSARLLRREFGFDAPSGRLDRFELRCQTHRLAAEFATDMTWRVPEAWGSCVLYVFGEGGAKFRLVEQPPTVAAATPPPAP